MLRLRLAVALLLSAGAVPVGIAPAVAAPSTSGTICVALVVDARSIGGPVDTGCTTVKNGATGLDVLEAAGHRLTFREDHLLCTIDGLPKAGCSAVDDTHFWAYYHRAPGATSWSYSSSGAGSYQPVNASTEGWVYEDGTKTEPDNVPHASICKTKITPSPTATSSTTHPAKPHHPAASGSTMTATPTRSASPRSTPPHRPRRHHRRATAFPTDSSPPLVSTSPSPSVSAAGGGSSSGGHGTVVGVIVAAVIAGGLGAAAIINNRRRRAR